MEKRSLKNKSSRRKQLREDLIADLPEAQTDEALLEILLSYSIPSIDLRPLTNDLIARYGSLNNIIAANYNNLIKIPGIKEYTATLIKVCDKINEVRAGSRPYKLQSIKLPPQQESLAIYDSTSKKPSESSISNKRSIKIRKFTGTGMVNRALIKEAIDLLPYLPETNDLKVILESIREKLHFNSEYTRKRYARYIVTYLFPMGYVDNSIRKFALLYPDHQELRDVCFYRFCKAYPLTYEIYEDLLIPNIGSGMIDRSFIRDYLKNKFPEIKDIVSGSRGFFEAFIGAQVVKSNKNTLSFYYREIRSHSFAFILHSEFQEPGIFKFEELEQNKAINSLLWKPDRIIPSLYELRNQGLISKVSEIDSVRQFTTKYTLEQLVEKLVIK